MLLNYSRYLALLYLVLSLLLGGCVESINIDTTKERKVVVNCLLNDSNMQSLSLSYSSSLGENTYDDIKDARIALFEGESLVGYFEKSNYEQWKMSFTPKPGLNYKLLIDIPGNKSITALTTFPKKTKTIYRVKYLDVQGKRYFSTKERRPFWIFALEKPGDTIMRPAVIEKTYKLYQTISTDYLNVDRFNQRLNSALTYTSKFFFSYIRMLPIEQKASFYVGKITSCVIVFRALSESYDRYLKSSIAKMLVYSSFEDPTQWLDESEIYNNIENGVGIFGAYSDMLFNCNSNWPD